MKIREGKLREIVRQVILKESQKFDQIELKRYDELDEGQKDQLRDLVDDADVHPEFSGYGLVKGEEKDRARLAIISEEGVVGFLTPRFDRGFWRTGAIFVGDQFRGKSFAKKAIATYFSDPSKRPARVWIADYNKSSQGAFISAGFERGERRDIGQAEDEKGSNYYLR